MTDDKDTNWNENSENATETMSAQSKAKEGGGTTEAMEKLYKNEGGKGKKNKLQAGERETAETVEDWAKKRQKHVKKDGEAIKSGVNKS